MSDEELILCIRLTNVWEIGRPQVTMASALTVVGFSGIECWALSIWWIGLVKLVPAVSR